MYRGFQGTWSELGRGKKEEDTFMARVWWACTLGRKMFQKHIQQLRRREQFSHGNDPETSLSAARESKKILNPCVLSRTPMGVPQAREGQAQTCKRCFSLLDLQREKEDGPGLQHTTPAWVLAGVRRCHPAPEDKTSLPQLDKSSLWSQGSYRLIGQGTGTEVPVNMDK